jgi:hypothetical protein
MDERIARLTTPADCEAFARNVEDRLPQLAFEARRRGIELRAATHNPRSRVELEALEAVYAYERVLSARKGKNVRAARTWQMIDRYGIIEAVERLVRRDDDPSGYAALASMGMLDLSWEAVVVGHPDVFNADTLARSRARLERWAPKGNIPLHDGESQGTADSG